MLRRARLLNVAWMARSCQPAAVTWRRKYVLKTTDQLEEKKRGAFMGGGQKRIDKQHKTVSNEATTLYIITDRKIF